MNVLVSRSLILALAVSLAISTGTASADGGVIGEPTFPFICGGTPPPPEGGYGLVIGCGGSSDFLRIGSCGLLGTDRYWVSDRQGGWVIWVPDTTVSAVNAQWLTMFGPHIAPKQAVLVQCLAWQAVTPAWADMSFEVPEGWVNTTDWEWTIPRVDYLYRCDIPGGPCVPPGSLAFAGSLDSEQSYFGNHLVELSRSTEDLGWCLAQHVEAARESPAAVSAGVQDYETWLLCEPNGQPAHAFRAISSSPFYLKALWPLLRHMASSARPR